MTSSIGTSANNEINFSNPERILLIPYARVSIKRQGVRRRRLEDQRLKLEGVDMGKYVLGEFFSDVGSARNEEYFCNRPGLNKAMGLALKLNAAIVVTSADRFTRTPSTYVRFAQQGGIIRVLDLGFGVLDSSLHAAMYRTKQTVTQQRKERAHQWANYSGNF